jgi:transcriptional regulator with XRE-family HTH domain
MTFAEKLTLLMADRVNRKVARRIGVSAVAIAAWMDGTYQPKAAAALRLARALGVSFEWLVDPDQGLPVVYASGPKRGAKVA